MSVLFSIARILFGCLFILPVHFALAGGLRFHFGLSLISANLCIIPLIIMILWQEGKKIYLESTQQLAICSLIFSYFLVRLYNSELGPLVSFGCADAANHLGLYRNFISTDPKSYHGFNALYVSWWFFEKIIGLGIINALVVSLTLPIFSIAYIIANFSPRLNFNQKEAIKFAIFLLATITLAETCILPIVHYNQADGYLAHLYSISAFLFVIYFGNNLGILALGLSLIAFRFSYGLQLPDLLGAVSLAFGINAIRAKGLLSKIYYGVGSSVLLISTCFGLISLIKVFSLSGSILSQSLENAFAAQIAGIALLVSFGFRNSFELWFLVSISFIQTFWLFATDESEYYFSKLFLYSSLLLAIMALRELPHLLKSKQSLHAVTWIALLTFLVLAQRPYLPSYLERSLTSSDYRLLSPQLDPKVKEIIDEVLISEKKAFFSYFTSRWAQYSFFNALYQTVNSYDSFLNPARELPPNSCIFWSSNSNDIGRLEKYPAPIAVEWLKTMNQKKDAKIVKYQVDWAGRQVIKYLCSGEVPLALP